ncbi:MAG: twin-arginine translocase subunit TatC [Proteobacteria bacterium]|nr:twin-arginine translocase subunit TatC [Pseudomonadota bacterium]
MTEDKIIEDSKAGSLMSHLVELRDRVVRMVLSILIIFLSLFYWANDIYSYLAEPLTRHLPEGSTMIAIDVASPFLTPFKLVLMLSVFLSMPVILYQFWAFVAPGLYQKEKRIAGPLLVSSIFLFYAGMAFAYYVVFPLVFGFFTSVGPEMVNISTDIGRYLDFVLALFFGFGLAFEVPIATIILVSVGVTTPKKLGEKRPYVIVAAFILGMFLTPPDVISQVLLAIPMWVLFEVGIIASSIIFKDRLAEDAISEEIDDVDQEDDILDDDTDYHPLTDEEMEAELARAEGEETDTPDADESTGSNSKK